jgi:CheY-like chemotaxis protein
VDAETVTNLILIVDDDEDFCAVARIKLEGAGYAVAVARNGREALDYLVDPESTEPACVLLDMEMPGLSGWDLLAVIKSYSRLRRIPVVVLSAHARRGSISSSGIPADWLQKPQDWTNVVRAIETCSAPAHS